MNKKQILTWLEENLDCDYVFSSKDDEEILTLVKEEFENGYELYSVEDVKLLQDKCWFDKETMKAIRSDGIMVGYFIPKKYL